MTVNHVTAGVPIGCPRCYSRTHGATPMRFVSNHDEHGYSERERRTLVICPNPECGHTCLVIVQLIDADNPGRAA